MADPTTESQEAPATTASTEAPASSAPESQAAAVTPTPEASTTPAASAEAKPEGDAAAKAAADAAAAEAAAKPVEYDLKLPEGVVKGELMEDLKAFAKEKGLTNEDAQKLTDLGVKQAQGFVTQLQEAQKAQAAKWAEETSTDKEIGGEMLDENLSVAKKALDSFGSKEFKTLLKESGLGNHPEVVRFMVKAGKAISEDGRLITGAASQKNRDSTPIENRLYPNLK